MEDFRTETLPRTAAAVAATYRADAGPYIDLWAEHEPVSLFGALGPCETRPDSIASALRGVAARFGDAAMAVEHEVVEVGTDLAYTVGYEQGVLSIDGRHEPTRIRVTHVYRLEDDRWRLVHRHGDFDPLRAAVSSPSQAGAERC